MRLNRLHLLCVVASCAFAPISHLLHAQSHNQYFVRPTVPELSIPTPAPLSPPARPFHDSRYGVSFHIPAGWNISSKDGELSTFGLDARSAPRAAQMRAVATINFNPLPRSTFSGAIFYFSVLPKATEATCRHQITSPAPTTVTSTDVGGVSFLHGYDEHGGVCTEARDQTYAAFRAGTCYRFDLVINTFCGGEVSGARDMTDKELDSVRQRLESILSTVKFEAP